MELQIKNFQSIKNANISLGGMVTITGKSNTGKSAVRRALDTLFFNNWDKSYISEGERETSVKLVDGDSHISVTKGNQKNEFCVNGVVYPKMGRGVPSEYETLGLKLISTDTNTYNLNINSQLDPLLFISTSDTENTRILNNVLDIGKIESSAAKSLSDLNKTKTRYNQVLTDIENLENTIKSKEKYFKAYSELVGEYENVLNNLNLIETYKELKDDFLLLDKECVFMKEKIDTLNTIINSENDQNFIVDYVLKLVDLEEQEIKIELYSKQIDKQDIIIYKTMCKNLSKHNDIVNCKTKLRDDLDKIIAIRQYLSKIVDLDMLNSSIANMKSELDNIYINLVGLECPTCGRSFQ